MLSCDFYKKFDAFYSYLYNHEEADKKYTPYWAKVFDKLDGQEVQFRRDLHEYNLKHEDIITSDREAAAFALAWTHAET